MNAQQQRRLVQPTSSQVLLFVLDAILQARSKRLSSEAAWLANGNSAVAMMASGQMHRNSSPTVLTFKSKVLA